MALKEDSKKYYDLVYYLDSFGQNDHLKEEHKNIVNSLLTNRLENEAIAAHPYEKIVEKLIKKIPTK